jgi:hypothetical protein
MQGFSIMMVFFYACNSTEYQRPTTALETGRTFIHACLVGDFDIAEPLLLSETDNIQLFSTYKVFYNKLTPEEKQHYAKANYQINSYDDVNDSVTVINYANDYLKKPMSIKLIRRSNEWSVDFRYIYKSNP